MLLHVMKILSVLYLVVNSSVGCFIARGCPLACSRLKAGIVGSAEAAWDSVSQSLSGGLLFYRARFMFYSTISIFII